MNKHIILHVNNAYICIKFRFININSFDSNTAV